MQRLLDEREKYEKILTLAFSDDKTFRNVMNQVQCACVLCVCACDVCVCARARVCAREDPGDSF